MARGGAYAARWAEEATCSWSYLQTSRRQVSPREVYSHTPAGDSYPTKRALNAWIPSLGCILARLQVSFDLHHFSGGLRSPPPAPATFVVSKFQ